MAGRARAKLLAGDDRQLEIEIEGVGKCDDGLSSRGLLGRVAMWMKKESWFKVFSWRFGAKEVGPPRNPPPRTASTQRKALRG